MKILLVDDEVDLLKGICRGLQNAGYVVDTAEDGEEGLYRAQNYEYDLIILDVMLPRIDGWTLLGKLRPQLKTPVLFLTARDAVPDRVRGLDAGADDYLVKPFELSELLARVRALIRRSVNQPQSVIELGEICINPSARTVQKSGQPIELTAREYRMLEYLAMHLNKVVTRTELYDHLYDENDDNFSNTLDVHVFNLRKKLGADLITTRRGHGYCIET